MGIEIERKFLVVGDAWRAQARRPQRLRQGYLSAPQLDGAPPCSVRVRIADDAATLNLKSATAGIRRDEFEYAIPLADAQALLALAHGVIDKVRHHVDAGPHVFEIDEFLGDNAGLVVAEIELRAIDEAFERPVWLGREVSDLKRYYNLHLGAHPYSRWSEAERNADDRPC